MSDQTVRVWDPLVRFFHWTLVVAFFAAYFTEDDLLAVHTWAGYWIGGLILFRILWGFVGPRYARFSDFVHRPAEVLQYLKDELRARARRHMGHNPAGGAMVVALLTSLSLTVVTGLVLLGSAECAGPLADWLCIGDHGVGEVIEDVHEFFANFTLLLVGLHVLGVIAASRLQGENLVAAMWHGRKRTNKQ